MLEISKTFMRDYLSNLRIGVGYIACPFLKDGKVPATTSIISIILAERHNKFFASKYKEMRLPHVDLCLTFLEQYKAHVN